MASLFETILQEALPNLANNKMLSKRLPKTSFIGRENEETLNLYTAN